MNISQLIADCRVQGIRFFHQDNAIRIYGSAAAIVKMLPLLLANKKAVLAYLSTDNTGDNQSDFPVNETNLFHTSITPENALKETKIILNRIMSQRS